MFIFTLPRGVSPSEAPQRSVKIKLNFFSSSGIGTGRVKMIYEQHSSLQMYRLIFAGAL